MGFKSINFDALTECGERSDSVVSHKSVRSIGREFHSLEIGIMATSKYEAVKVELF